MRKFKLLFYPIYLISTFLVLYFSLDILANMDSYKERMDMTFALRKLPIYLMSGFIFLGLLMTVEILIENFQIISLKRRLRQAEEEVTRFKAKLYDKAEKEEDEDDDDEGDEEDELDNDDEK